MPHCNITDTEHKDNGALLAYRANLGKDLLLSAALARTEDPRTPENIRATCQSLIDLDTATTADKE